MAMTLVLYTFIIVDIAITAAVNTPFALCTFVEHFIIKSQTSFAHSTSMEEYSKVERCAPHSIRNVGKILLKINLETVGRSQVYDSVTVTSN